MNILYHGAPPMADTGYGVCAKHLAPRFNKIHDVDIQSVAGFEGMGIDWEGIHIYPSGAGKFGEQSIPYWYRKVGADVVFSHHDHWSMADAFSGIQQAGIPTVLYTVLDNDLPGNRPPEPVVQACENSFRTVVMSEWAEERMKNSRVPDESVYQIPHGVNTTKYAPVTDTIPQEELKRGLGIPEDGFLFGMVAANYGPRKSIPMHMEAFKRLVEEDGADDAYLYIHAHPTMTDGYNLYQVRESLGLDKDRVMFPDPHEMYHGIEDMTIVQLLNTYDVHLNVTQSESWGMTITEALSCETPVIAANNSAQTEQMGVSHDFRVTGSHAAVANGVLVNRGATLWTQGSCARRYVPHVGDIHSALRYAYSHPDEMAERGENGRQWVLDNYQWDDLFEDEWKPLWDDVEAELEGDYNSFYFDRREQEASSQAFQQEVEKIGLELRGDEILDAGCGPGVAADHLAERGYDVVGVDAAEEAVQRTLERGVEAQRGDIADLYMASNIVDSAFAQHVLEHVEPDAKALSELARVAREKVVVIVPKGGPDAGSLDKTEVRRYTEDDLDRLKEEFEALTGDEMEYRLEHLTQASSNWFITVEDPEYTGEVDE